jgi:hypothetical protein
MAAGYLVAIIRKRRNLDSSPSGDVYRRAYLYGGYQRTGSGSDPYFGVGIGVNASDSVKVTGEFNFVAAELRKVTLAVVGQQSCRQPPLRRLSRSTPVFASS